MKVIAITGGIGAGKSIVSRILRLLGYDVYDCDFEAKRLMDNDSELKADIQIKFGLDAISANNTLNRPYISSRIFQDQQTRQWLNARVHAKVLEDLKKHINLNNSGIQFVESAIAVSSGITDTCDEVWVVTAPQELRVVRVMARNQLSRDQVYNRIEAQQSEESALRQCPCPLINIDNSPNSPLLQRITYLVKQSLSLSSQVTA